eukprot:6181512-Pleurochrysis_carterae.AAC.1
MEHDTVSRKQAKQPKAAAGVALHAAYQALESLAREKKQLHYERIARHKLQEQVAKLHSELAEAKESGATMAREVIEAKGNASKLEAKYVKTQTELVDGRRTASALVSLTKTRISPKRSRRQRPRAITAWRASAIAFSSSCALPRSRWRPPRKRLKWLSLTRSRRTLARSTVESEQQQLERDHAKQIADLQEQLQALKSTAPPKSCDPARLEQLSASWRSQLRQTYRMYLYELLATRYWAPVDLAYALDASDVLDALFEAPTVLPSPAQSLSCRHARTNPHAPC